MKDDENLVTVAGKTFENEDVEIDNKRFIKCKFIDCRLIFSGGGLPLFDSCEFSGEPRFDFGDHAARTLQMIHVLADNLYFGGAVKAVLENIIRPKPDVGTTH